MNLNDWLATELQEDIWRNKYQHGDETFEEWLDRVSGGNKKIRQLIKDKKFLFGGRILANRGVNDRKSTYSNCYLIESPRDNLEEIFQKAYETAKTFSYGGGVGLNLSHLSPKGAKIHNAAETTSGAVSFMDLYNQTSALIGQNKRRGALMLCMNSDHPDIEEFIDVKKDLNKINKANTSVMMKPEFWYCYKSGKDYEAVYCRPESDQVIRKQINPDKFLTHVAQNNWETGEPGMLFSDNINDYNFMSNYYPEFFIEATNPCVTGDTMIATPDGDVPIEQLVGLQPDVYCLDSRGIVTIQKASRVWRTKQNAEIYEVDFGFKKIKCTGDHKFLVDSVITGRLEWIEAQNLLPETQLIGVVDAGKCHRYDCYYNVKSVTKLDETADVYDMTVENYHNFIGNNVVLHNCVSGDTEILTDKGYRKIEDTIGESVNVWNGYEWSEVHPKVTGYNQPMLHIEFSDGSELDCTDYHKFNLKGNNTVEAKNLKIGDKLAKFEYPVVEYPEQKHIDSKEAYTRGFFTGDGYNTKDKNYSNILLYGNKKELKDYLLFRNERIDAISGKGHSEKNTRIHLTLTEKWDKDFIPDATYDVKTRLNWLAGYIDSDGSYNGFGSVTISSIHKDWLMKVKKMLVTLGCGSCLSLTKPAEKKKLPKNDGTNDLKYYQTKDCYRLTISCTYLNRLKELGLETHRVNLEYKAKQKCIRSIKVKNITRIDNADTVYCFNEPKNHTGMFNTIVTRQCGEQPLIDYDSCLLGSMNLAEYVIEDEDNEPDFDYFSFANDVEEAIYALNEVQKEGTYRHPLDMQINVAKKYRRVGLGIMGLADCLIKMGYEYSSKEARDFCSTIASTMLDSAVQASAYYAKEFGAFDGYDFNKISSSKFFKNTIFDDETISLVKEYGLYNSALLSIAPTGSISTMLGVSGGIEPIYDLSYTRKTESLNGKDTYYKVYTPIVEQYMKQHNIADESNLPDYFETAKNIHWMDRLQMQAVWQEFVDAAISSTINLPEETTVNDIKKLYVKAHDLGLKGVTVFRDNCFRAGILSSNDEPKDNASDDDKTKRLNTEEHKIKDVKPIDVKPENTVGKKRKLINGCVDGDTEYFNGTQWKKISEYQKGEKVLQYNKDGTASLVYPTDYIKRKSSGQYHIKTKYGLDMMVSPDHRNIVFDNKKDVNSFKIMTTNEIINEHNKLDNGFYKRFKTNFNYSGSGIDLTDDEIRIEVAIFADGCYYSPTSKKCMISVHKKRKRDRLIMLLERAGIEYSERINNRKYYDIKFYPPLKNREKQFPSEWYNCTQHQFQVIFDEVFKWDGYEKKNNQYSTVIKSNADFVQFVCTVTGHRSTINVDIRKRRPTYQTAYRVDWNNKVYCSLIHRDKYEFKLIQPKDGYDYCFSVPSTMLVLRRNNRIFVTGNCGSLHVMAYFDKETGRLLEVFLGKGSTGGCQGYMTGLARMISLSARNGSDISQIVDQLHSVPACPSYVGRFVRNHDTSKGSNCPGAIGYALVDMFLEMQSEIDRGLYDDKFDIDSPIEDEIKKVESVVKKKDKPANDYVPEDMRCPECGDTLVRASGCLECKSCGWSKCN